MTTTLAVVVASLIAVAPAHADVSPPVDSGDPVTVTADALPTVQINGIVWDQEVVGNVVYAAGSFSTARPAGAAAGTNETPRSNLLAYNLTTGELITSFAPNINAQVRSVAASPDGTRLYIVGDFTSVNGVTRNRVAAFDLPSGNLAAFNPNSNGTTIGVAATNSTVYITGNFGRVAGNDRLGAAAITRDGSLLPWAPVLGERRGRVVVVSPDETKVALGGDFPTLNGSSNPGYGLALVDAVSGGLLPSGVNNVIRNAGNDAAIVSLRSDGDSFYGTGYVFGRGGNLEGSFRASWDSGDLVWVNDCHGDQYDVYPMGDVVYAAGHPHYCGSLVGGFPQSDPWTFYRAIAVTKDVERITPFGLNLGYYEFGGNPAPKFLHWLPVFNAANVSGAWQGPWTVTGNSEYVVFGGEFTRVNYRAQQGLVRFAVSSKAPNEQGPHLWNTDWMPEAQPIAGAIRVSWPTNQDRDSEYLHYEVVRDGAVIKRIENVRSKSPDWGLPPVAYVDTDVTDGTTYSYRIRALDNEGHSIMGGTVTATASGSVTASGYRDAVLADSPQSYWPLDDTTPSISYDWAGASDLTVNNGVSRGITGAIIDESRTAARFNGNTNSFASTTKSIAGPNTFGIEAWVRTTSTRGGKIVGFGNRSTGTSTSYDRHVYMETNGRITFGVYPGSSQTITSAQSFNDGQWHHISAGLSSEGMVLYVDGVRVAQRSDVTSAQSYNGFWRVGGDSTWAGDRFINGEIDEVAIYGAPLTRQQVAAHYTASGRTLEGATVPTDEYGAAVYGLEPALYWRLGEASGTIAQDASGFNQRGNYVGSHEKGAAGALEDVADTAVTFTGGQVISQGAFNNPRSYSEEAWFKTTTTTGGKIIGLGSSGTGNSSSYDRHVFMTNTGKLVFGVYTGSEVRIESPLAYNDGEWHHMVATQGTGGMRLYVDGVLVGQNGETNAENYTGYWHVGGDVSWGPGDNAFDGTIDDVAVYMFPLPAETVAHHFALGTTGEPANIAPTASFTSAIDKLDVTVDAAGSFDVDGAVASYSWNWGDGSEPADGVTATHSYAEAGDYTVTLTVTDDDGAEGTASTVVQAVANQAPVASFSSSIADLTVTVDATASIDTDGAIESYSWNWGDGTADDTTPTATHTYAADGTYMVTLTVTDDDGEAAQKTESMTVAAPVGATTYARDSFNRTQATGLGTADQGGDWTLAQSAGNYLVDGAGTFVQPAGGAQRFAYLTGVSSDDTAMDVDVVLTQLPIGGSAYYTSHVRRVGSDDYRSRIIVAANGSVTAQLQRGSTVLTNVGAGITLVAGDALHVRTEATGVSPTELRMKVWKVGTPEPEAWTTQTTDSAAALQTAGHIGLGVYLGGSVSNVPFQTRFDNLWAGSTDGVPEPLPNEDPTAAFTAAPNGLGVHVDASTSGDPDGTIASYEWDFGDGATGDGAVTDHTYDAEGTYTVTLVVTDDDGATATAQQSVTVVDGPVNQAPVAAFGATTTGLDVSVDGAASSDPDGTVAAYAWSFGDGATAEGVTATHTYGAGGTYTVTLTVTDDGGATHATSQDVTVAAPPGTPFAADDFGRADGLLGTAQAGGNWTQTSGAGNVGIEGGAAKFTSSGAGQTRSATLNGAPSTSTDLSFSFRVDALPVGARMYVSALGRVVGGEDYRARWLIDADGAVQAQLARGGTVIGWVNIAGLAVEAGVEYKVRLQVFGTGTTTLRSKIWVDGTEEPADWQLGATDTTATLQTAGHTGMTTYAGGGFSNLPYSVYFDDYSAVEVAP